MKTIVKELVMVGLVAMIGSAAMFAVPKPVVNSTPEVTKVKAEEKKNPSKEKDKILEVRKPEVKEPAKVKDPKQEKKDLDCNEKSQNGKLKHTCGNNGNGKGQGNKNCKACEAEKKAHKQVEEKRKPKPVEPKPDNGKKPKNKGPKPVETKSYPDNGKEKKVEQIIWTWTKDGWIVSVK